MSIDSVPVIDIRQLQDPATLAELDLACRHWGFFQVVQHGIKDPVIAALKAAMMQFFQQSSEAKNSIARTADNQWGFYDSELTKNVRDWKEIYDYGPAQGELMVPQWPAGLPAFQAAVRNYYRASEQLCLRLLAAIASNLGVAADTLEKGFGTGHTSFVRLNYYPPCLQANVDQTLGINPHTDAGALTCLLQDSQPGLEVYKDDRWYLVEPRADALVINIGDIIQVWSNDTYKAALHRVISSNHQPRYSAPFFLNPQYSLDYQPLPSTVSAARPSRYTSINWGEFRQLRAAGDYADYGEEVQISQYRDREMAP